MNTQNTNTFSNDARTAAIAGLVTIAVAGVYAGAKAIYAWAKAPKKAKEEKKEAAAPEQKKETAAA